MHFKAHHFCGFVALVLVALHVVSAAPSPQWKSLYPLAIFTNYAPIATYPSSVYSACTWVDTRGNVWMFAGYSSYYGVYNDLWLYTVSSNTWSPIFTLKAAAGYYNGVGQAGYPMQRFGHSCWVGSDGLFYAFGGYRSDGPAGHLSDLWSFNTTSLIFTQRYGDTTVEKLNTMSVVGGRRAAVSWTTPGKLWLFGGQSNNYYFADVRSYDIYTSTWSFEGGSSVNDAYSPTNNFPGSRSEAGFWTDKSGNMWLIGGTGRTNTATLGTYLNDLWMWDVSAKTFTYIGGSLDASLTPGINVAVVGGVGWPSGRRSGGCVTTPDGSLWLIGGEMLGGNTNDLWSFDTISRTFRKLYDISTSGTNQFSVQPSTIGGSATMGSRKWAAAFVSDRRVFLFGGYGYATVAPSGYLADFYVSGACFDGPSGTCYGHGECDSSVPGTPANCSCSPAWITDSCSVLGCNTQAGELASSQEVCSCYSGYSGQLCDTAPSTSCVAAVTTKTSTAAPLLVDHNSMRYESNTLFATLVGPQVNSRLFTNLTFEGATSTICMFGFSPSVWSQTFLNETCQDAYYLVLPWANHSLCGFQRTADPLYVTYSAKVYMQYRENIGNFSGLSSELRRFSEYSTSIYVKFPLTLEVSMDVLDITSDIEVDFALTREQYDPVLRELRLELTSSVVYSHMVLYDTAQIETPEIFQVTETSYDNSWCSAQPGSVCTQKVFFTIKTTEEEQCSFNGIYSLTVEAVACRENGGSGCARTNVTVDFSLNGGSLCASVGIESDVSAVLKAYPTSDFFALPQTSYNLGEQVFFYIDVNGGYGNTISLKFIDITANDNGMQGLQFLLQNETRTTMAEDATLTLNGAAKYFSLFLSGKAFRGIIGGSGSYTFAARCEVTFDGNKKREIKMEWENTPSDSSVVTARTRVNIVKHQHTNYYANNCATVVSQSHTAQESQQSTLMHAIEKDVGALFIVGSVGSVCVALMVGFVVGMVVTKKQQQYSQLQINDN